MLADTGSDSGPQRPPPNEEPAGAIYRGTVIHKRLRPVPHALRYSVFTLWLDLDRLDEVAAKCRWFSCNRFNLIAFYDADHGPGDLGPANTAADHVRQLCADADVLGAQDKRPLCVQALCYPRVLGYVFNPLTVYLASDPSTGAPRAMVYEVNNTFGDRRSYVIPLSGDDVSAGNSADTDHSDGSPWTHGCAKQLFVSPFNRVEGSYRFHVLLPGERCVVGILHSNADGPLLKAFFAGDRHTLNDTGLLATLIRYPLMTLKVMGAIHVEALRLWWKGLKLNKRPRGPRFAVSPGAGDDA